MHSINEGGVLLIFLTGKLPWRAISGLSRSRNRSCVNYFLFSGLTASTNSQKWLLLRFLSFAGSKLFFFYAFSDKEGFQWRLVSLCLQCLILERSKLSTIQDKLVHRKKIWSWNSARRKNGKKQSNKQIRKLWIKSRVSKQRHPFVWSELSKG